MAVVNRFYNPRSRNLINPISFQELAIAPQYMRQQHDITEATAAENAVNQANVLQADADLARSQYAKVEDEFNGLVTDLTKSGFDQSKRSRLIGLLRQKKELERDVIQPLEARKQSYLAQAAQISEFFKDDPQSRENTLKRLAMSNQSASNIDPSGKLNVPGISTPFYARVMSDEDLAKMENDAFKTLEKEEFFTNTKVANIKSLPEFYTAVQEGKISGIDAQRIQQRLEEVLGRDVMNSYRQQAYNQGLGLNPEMDAIYKQNALESIASTMKAQGLNQGAIDSRVKNLSKLSAVDLHATLNRSKRIGQTAQSLAYRQTELDTKYLEDKGRFELWKRSLGDEDITGGYVGTVDIAYENKDHPFNITGVFTERNYDEKGNLTPHYQGRKLKLSPGDVIQTTVTNKYDYFDDKGDKVHINKATGFTSLLTGAKTLKEGYTAKLKESDKKADQLIDTLNTLRKEIPQFRNLSDQQIVDRLNLFKENNKAATETGVFSPKDSGKPFRRNYLGGYENGKFQLGRLAGKRMFSLNIGEADKTMEAVAIKELGYDNLSEFYEAGGLSNAVYVPTLGKYISTVQTEDGEDTRNIYIEPEEGLKRVSAPLTEAYDAVLRMEPYKKVKSAKQILGGNTYVVNDFFDGNSYIINSDEEIDSYEQAIRYAINFANNPDKVKTMYDYTQKITQNLILPSEAYQSVLDINE